MGATEWIRPQELVSEPQHEILAAMKGRVKQESYRQQKRGREWDKSKIRRLGDEYRGNGTTKTWSVKAVSCPKRLSTLLIAKSVDNGHIGEYEDRVRVSCSRRSNLAPECSW